MPCEVLRGSETLNSKYSKLLRAENGELDVFLDSSRQISRNHFGKRIRFYAPGFACYENSYFRSSPTSFSSISVTGNFCALKCKHCQGKVLETMIPALTPSALIDVCVKLREKNCAGCLISGGCLPDGSIPIDRFLEAIAYIKKDLGLKVFVHTGIISRDRARKLKEAGIDAALIDVIGSNETIREIYQLRISVDDYEMSLRALHDSGIPLIPHVLVGLHYGKILGEVRALKIISKYEPEALVVIALMPIEGTLLRDSIPPTPEDVARIIIIARSMMQNIPIVLGCMRPLGEHRIKTDKLAVKSGVNAIAFPDEAAINLAKSMGMKITFSPMCCSQIYEDVGKEKK